MSQIVSLFPPKASQGLSLNSIVDLNEKHCVEKRICDLFEQRNYMAVLKLCTLYEGSSLLTQRIVDANIKAESELLNVCRRSLKNRHFQKAQHECAKYLNIRPNDVRALSLQRKAKLLQKIANKFYSESFDECLEGCYVYISQFFSDQIVLAYLNKTQLAQMRLSLAREAVECKKYWLAKEQISLFLKLHPQSKEGQNRAQTLDHLLRDVEVKKNNTLAVIPDLHQDSEYRCYYAFFLEMNSAASVGNFSKASELAEKIGTQNLYRSEDRDQLNVFFTQASCALQRTVEAESKFREGKWEEGRELFQSVIVQTNSLRMPGPTISPMPTIRPSMKLEEVQEYLNRGSFKRVIKEYKLLKRAKHESEHFRELEKLLIASMSKKLIQIFHQGLFDETFKWGKKITRTFHHLVFQNDIDKILCTCLRYQLVKKSLEFGALYFAEPFAMGLIQQFPFLAEKKDWSHIKARMSAKQAKLKVQSQSEHLTLRLFDQAKAAYRNGNFQDAIELCCKLKEEGGTFLESRLIEGCDFLIEASMREFNTGDLINVALEQFNPNLVQKNMKTLYKNFQSSLDILKRHYL